MVLETIIQVATLISVIIGFLSLMYFINSFRRELNMQVVIHFSERFEKLMDALPDNFFLDDFFQEELPPRTPKLSKDIMKYFNLTAEEHYLYQNRYMSRKLWSRWEPDIKNALKHPVIRREWEKMKHQWNPTSEFRSFVENCLEE